MKMKLRVINSGYNNPYVNMAIDEALLLSDIPVLRFYQWKPSSISIGYGQSMEHEINIKKCDKLGVGYVRRITGGKAVFHDKEVTYTFIINEKMMPKSIIESYKEISEALIDGFIAIGLSAKMKEEADKSFESSNCFHMPSYYELTINNKKFVGSAQKRIGGKILQHGSILLDFDVDLMCSLFTHDSDAFRDETIKRVTNISLELKREVLAKEVIEKLIMGFKKKFQAEIVPSELSMFELEKAHELANNKYATKEWNFLR